MSAGYGGGYIGGGSGGGTTAHDIDGALHTLAGATAGQKLTTLSATTFEWQAAETALPKGTWLNVNSVTFAAAPGQPSTVRLRLQDGKLRTFSGTLTWNETNGEADLGFDVAASEGASRWYYFYMVPSAADDDVLTVRASNVAPTTGPTGYTNFKYCWAGYSDVSENMVCQYQIGNKFHRNTFAQVFSGGTHVTPDAAMVDIDLAAFAPVTARAVELSMRCLIPAEGTYGQWAIHWSYDGTTDAYIWYPSGNTTGYVYLQLVKEFYIPSDGILHRQNLRTAGAANMTVHQCMMQAYTDEWLSPAFNSLG